MKQDKLLRKLYKACIEHDALAAQELRKEEFKKIFKHKLEGKPFGPKWTLVRL